VNHFAADVDATRARVMYAVQQPLAGSALQEVMGAPAWRSLPSWYLVADGDQAIPPDAERLFAKRLAPGGRGEAHPDRCAGGAGHALRGSRSPGGPDRRRDCGVQQLVRPAAQRSRVGAVSSSSSRTESRPSTSSVVRTSPKTRKIVASVALWSSSLIAALASDTSTTR
jgi:hypothetical protein